VTGLSPSSVEHAFPFIQLMVAAGVLLVGLVGGLWRGFVWLDQRIAARIETWSTSPGFESAVTRIVTQAFTATADLNNRLHEESRRSISELRKRDEERLDAIKRLHGRVDKLWETVPRKKHQAEEPND